MKKIITMIELSTFKKYVEDSIALNQWDYRRNDSTEELALAGNTIAICMTILHAQLEK